MMTCKTIGRTQTPAPTANSNVNDLVIEPYLEVSLQIHYHIKTYEYRFSNILLWQLRSDLQAFSEMLVTGREERLIFPGVFLLKLPSSRTRQAAIAIEINPVDSAGSATKKRGIVVRSASELDEFNRILANQKLVELARKVDLVNPKQTGAPAATGSNVFEI